MDTTSLWMAISPPTKNYPKLQNNIEVDVLIIGGGITGITTAKELIDSGKSVAVVEANKIGHGTTGYSTGNLYILIQSYYQNIASSIDDPLLKAIAQARSAAIDYIEENVKKHKISCNFLRRPSYLYTNDESKIPFLDKEAEYISHANVEIEYPASFDTGLSYKKALKIPNQARINPLAYTQALAEYVAKNGVAIYENTPIVTIDTEKNKCVAYTEEGEIHAKKIVMATHIPKGVQITSLLAPAYRSYVVAVRLQELKKLPSGHYWGVSPHYVLSTHCSNPEANEDDLMMIAGSHHQTGKNKDTITHFLELENYLKEHYNVSGIAYRWSAQHYQSADGIPYIGPISPFHKNVYIASGYFADGLVFGTAAGQILANLINNKSAGWGKYALPHRLTQLSSMKSLAIGMLDTYIEYAKDLPRLSQQDKIKELKPGDAKVLEIDGQKCGVYKDQEGKVHAVSAICTHMKCLLNWNNSETSWDCPCHGSRFTCDGEVIEGPAYDNLKKIPIKSVDADRGE